MSKRTLYDILGVDQDASEDEIRRAFRKLTLEHHPDRFQGDARARAEGRFQEITEAFNVLSRKASREKYDKELNAGGESTLSDPKEIARRLAAKGAQAFKSGQLVEAADTLVLAVHHDDRNGRAHYFLGLTLLKLPGREREGLRHLDRAAALEPENAQILGDAAQQFLVAGLKSRAERLAVSALERDPTNSKATSVLQRLGNDDDSEEAASLLGLFKRKG